MYCLANEYYQEHDYNSGIQAHRNEQETEQIYCLFYIEKSYLHSG